MRPGAEGELKRVLGHRAVVPVAVIALTVLGGVLRLSVARQDLFADELATYWVVSTRGLRGLVEAVASTAEITPPFSFVLSWLTTRAGLSPVLVRLPALLGGIISIPLVYAVGARTVGRWAALLGATMTTLSAFMIFYSSEARGYGVLMALVLLSTLALLLALDEGRTHWWVAYGALVCLAMYTHYTALFVLGAQFGWAFFVRPEHRRALLVSTGVAALLYLPWLPSLKGDMDSPTTDILSDYSALDLASVRMTLNHWTLGFPFAGPGRELRDLPGVPAMLLLVASIGVGAYGVYTMRSRLSGWFGARQGRLGLIVLLALATPVGTALESAVGTNVFSTRSLAASWPYLALALAALITVGSTVLRLTATTLAVAAFALGTLRLGGSDFERPAYSELARFTEARPESVVVDGAGFTPGPLTNFDVEGVEVYRLNIPEQNTTPFAIGEPVPDIADVTERAVTAAAGGPITVLAFSPQRSQTLELIERLPPDYVLTEQKTVEGLLDVQALVFERSP